MKIREVQVKSRSGGECRLKFPGIKDARVVDAENRSVKSSIKNDGVLVFATSLNQSYRVIF
jgi:hypothetical protein